MQSSFLKNSHCSYCGSKFAEQVLWPRKCFRCGHDSYGNPVPVVATLIWVRDDSELVDNDHQGLLVQKRRIAPGKGLWAFPSGYVELGETWQEACARELQEEVGLVTQPNEFLCLEAEMGNDNGVIVIFAYYLKTIQWRDINFSPNDEVSEIKLISKVEELAFPSHTKLLTSCLSNEP
jgi:ADP-ribose pyrophosphatase YjhB (NUDIX family)